MSDLPGDLPYPVSVLLLALDTSTSAITAALSDGVTTRSATRLDPRGHAEWTAPQIARLLSEAGRSATELTHIVAGEGPGPFTGLRVGLVTAETMAYATGASYAGVTSLDALAAGAVLTGSVGEGEFVVATDARRREVYWARYRYDGTQVSAENSAPLATALTRCSEPAVSSAAELPRQVRALSVVGRGAELYPEELPNGVGPLDVDAAHLAALALARLGAGTLGVRERAHPLYLRRPDAAPNAAAPLVPTAEQRAP